MSTELSNGVIIPEEYSDDWYDEMSINLRKLNDVITAASDNATDIQRLDTDKANQSDLTALTSRVSQNETDIIALQTAVSGALKREIVQTLPTEDISTTTIYMIRNSQSSGTNIYDEYMYINSQWELIGTSATDFSNYYTKNETDNLLSGKVDNSTLGSYYTKTESDNLLSAKANQTDLTALSGRVTQTETDITALQTAVSGALKREIVQSLPTQDISTTTIYMIRNTTTSGDNIYDEYMYINNLWELIGTSATDLTNYYTKSEVDGKLLLKANASDLTSHTGDTTIHVTANDKTKWTNSANTVVLRLAKTALTPSSSTNAFSNLDDATALKVGDKVMDTAGVLFEVTAIDTANSTFTIGTSLIDLAQDSDVVHKSGAETVSGNKTFTYPIAITSFPSIRMYLTDDDSGVLPQTNKQTEIRFTDKNSVLVSYFAFQHRSDSNEPFRTCWRQQKMDGTSGYYSINFNNLGDFYPESNNTINFGTSSKRWKSVYATNYYYGGSEIEFSTKFVTTDTNQTITGNKTFSSINGVEPSSLSLPSDRSARVDISSYFTDTSNGAVNRYTVPANGYVYLNVADVVSMHLLSQTSNNLTHYGDTKARGSVGQLNALLPVRKNDVFACQWYTTATNVTLTSAYFIPCQGNI